MTGFPHRPAIFTAAVLALAAIGCAQPADAAGVSAALFKLTADTNWIIQRADFARDGIPVELNFGTPVGNSQADGAELAIDGTFGEGWRWGANYRWETVRDKFAPYAQGGVDYIDHQPTTPQHVGNLNLGWADDRWELDGCLRNQSQIFGPTPGGTTAFTVLQPVPKYVSLDARIAYRLREQVTLALYGQNLGLSEQRQSTAPDVERRVLFTVTAGL